MNIEYTCIKEKGKGIYKNVKTAIYSVEPNETPNDDNPSPVVYPEIDSPDFDDPDYLEVYPDYMGVYSEIDSNDQSNDQSVDSEIDNFELIVWEVRQDIASGQFLDKFLYYMDLLKVTRYELDSFLDYEFDFNNPENFEIKVKDAQVFDRLFALYCPDDAFVIPPKTNHHVKQWLDRLDKDGRYFPKKQLNIFGEV